MGKVIAGITMSLDGYVNDASGSLDKLYADFQELHAVQSFKEMIEQTGAVIMGKNAYDMGEADSWNDYEFQTPIFVLTHETRETHVVNEKLQFIFVTDGIESAITQARDAAQGKDVQIIGGAGTIQQALLSGMCDEFSLDIISIVLGDGLPLFKGIDSNTVSLTRRKVEPLTSQRTNFLFQVTR